MNNTYILEKRKTYAGVDLTKFFFAVCIVALHSNAFEFMPHNAYFMLEKALFRLAVPYFFVTSGFFVGNKLNRVSVEEYGRIVKNYCRRLLEPFIVFSAINILLNCAVYVINRVGVAEATLRITRSLLFYPRGALWYVSASMVGMLLLLPFLKRKRVDLAIVIGFFLYCFALICNNYYFVIQGTAFQKMVDTYLDICISARNGLFTGFLCLGLGVLCSKVYNNLSQNKHKIIWVGTALYVIYLAEIVLVAFAGTSADDGSLYITHLLLVPALLFLTLSQRIVLRKELSETLRNLSTGIYFLHIPISKVISIINLPEFLKFILVLITAVTICLLAYKTKKEPFYRLLK